MEQMEVAVKHLQDTGSSDFGVSSLSPADETEWPSSVHPTLSTVSHTLEAGLCEGRFEADAATVGSLIAPNLCEAAGTVSAVPHNVAAACPPTLSAMRTQE